MKDLICRHLRLIGMSTFAAAVLAVGAVGLTSTQSEAALKGCICPHIVFPVKCSNGVTYINGCYAACAGATGCVPTGGPL